MSLDNLTKKEIMFLLEYTDQTFTRFDLSDSERKILDNLTDYSYAFAKGEFIEEVTDEYGNSLYRVVNFSFKDVLLFLVDTLLLDESENT